MIYTDTLAELLQGLKAPAGKALAIENIDIQPNGDIKMAVVVTGKPVIDYDSVTVSVDEMVSRGPSKPVQTPKILQRAMDKAQETIEDDEEDEAFDNLGNEAEDDDLSPVEDEPEDTVDISEPVTLDSISEADQQRVIRQLARARNSNNRQKKG